ncbi:hypothetical protein P4B35_09135 [Pontiellaceae bacterium B12227]|nr:hypothetical protein [Pontiellaceae bacterium B12227]
MKSNILMVAFALSATVSLAGSPETGTASSLSSKGYTLPTTAALFIEASPGYEGVGTNAIYEAIPTNFIPLNYLWAVQDAQHETLMKGFYEAPENSFSFDPSTLSNGEYRITLTSESTSGSVITSAQDYLFKVEWPAFSVTAELWPTNPVTPGDAPLTFTASIQGDPAVLQAVADEQIWELGLVPFVSGSSNNVVLDSSSYNPSAGEALLIIDENISGALEYNTNYVVRYRVSNPMSGEEHSVDFTFSTEPLPDHPPVILSYQLSSSLNSVIIKFDQATNLSGLLSASELTQLLSSSHSLGASPLGVWQSTSTLAIYLGPAHGLELNVSTVTILPEGNLRHISGLGEVSTNTSPPLTIENIEDVADLTVEITGPQVLGYNSEVQFLSEVENYGGQPMDYMWSVDGLVTTGLVTNAYYFILPALFAPAGNHELALTVTDFLGREATANHVFKVLEPPAPPAPQFQPIGPEYFPFLRISVSDPDLEYELQATTNLAAEGGGWYTVDGPKTGSRSYTFITAMDLPAQFFRAIVRVPEAD